MKKLIAALALTAGLLLTGCDPDTSGIVIDKKYEYYGNYPDDFFIFKIKIKGVTTHGEVIWWKEVSADIWTNCDVGESWDADDPGGCPD